MKRKIVEIEKKIKSLDNEIESIEHRIYFYEMDLEDMRESLLEKNEEKNELVEKMKKISLVENDKIEILEGQIFMAI